MKTFFIGSVIEISKTGGNLSAIAEAKKYYSENNYVLLDGFLDSGLVDYINSMVIQAQPELFYEEHEGQEHIKGHVFTKNKDLQLTPNILLNQNKVLAALKEITSEEKLKSAVCYVYRSQETDRHALHWHQDLIEQKLFVISANLSKKDYKGGEFALRQKSTKREFIRLTNNVPGRMILARIGEDWEHETTKVIGENPRLTMAGWGMGHEWRPSKDLIK